MDDRDGPGGPEDDFDADASMARWVADIEAGRERIPEEWETEGPAVSLSLGDACDIDPALLAAAGRTASDCRRTVSVRPTIPETKDAIESGSRTEAGSRTVAELEK